MSIEISNILSKLNQDGQTIVMVTHNEELAKKFKKNIGIKGWHLDKLKHQLKIKF